MILFLPAYPHGYQTGTIRRSLGERGAFVVILIRFSIRIVVSTAMMSGSGCGESREICAQFLRLHDCNRRSPGEQMPAHLLHPASAKAYSQRAAGLALDALRRMKQPAGGIVRRLRLEPQHHIDRLLLEDPERLRRIDREIEVLAARKSAIEQIDGDNPIQPPQPHLRQRGLKPGGFVVWV